MNPMTQALAQQHIADLRKQACMFNKVSVARKLRRKSTTR